MANPTDRVSAFPSPYEIETPPGCEGWQEMYPYHALFDERRRESDENRFWFWNSMHFPLPMPAFDVFCADSPYQAFAEWQNRFFAVPPAMGIEYRIVNGYVYISGNPITDPDKIAERAEFFQRRAGYYFEHWDELYQRWKEKMQALIAEVTNLRVPDLPEYHSDDLMVDGRNTAFYEVLDAYGRLLRCGDLAWQHHFELLMLGYGAYMTFADFCRTHLPDIPDQHVAQMIAGIDVVLFKPSAELRRLAQLAIDKGVDGVFVEGRSPEEIDAELARSEAGRAWLEELEKVKDPWFNMATGDGLYHYYRSWYDDPSIPYASIVGHVQALKEGKEGEERPTEELARERDRLAEEYGALLDEESRTTFRDLLELSRKVFPYVEEHKFYCDYWFLTRWWNKVREFGALLAKHGFLEDSEDIFHLTRHEVAAALDDLLLSWATGGQALGPRHWPPIVARRKELLERLAKWTPPPALGATPDEITDPSVVMLWGVTTERVREWAAATEGGGGRLLGAAASPGVVEGVARVVIEVEELARVREGEILVCPITSPAWAPIFSSVKAVVTDIGGVMSHAAIVCREYGLPAVVGTGRATAEIRTGQKVRVAGTNGVATVLDA